MHCCAGDAPDELVSSAPATTSTYARADMCGGPAAGDGWLEPGLLHSAVLSGESFPWVFSLFVSHSKCIIGAGLQPGDTFFYAVGDAGPHAPLSSWSDVFRGVAPSPPGGESARVLVVADFGQAERDGSNIDVDIGSQSERSYFSMVPSLATVDAVTAEATDGAAAGRPFGACFHFYHFNL